MTDTVRYSATFTVPSASPQIPAGIHPGYVDIFILRLRGHETRQMARAMAHIERADYPEFFSAKNSIISANIDVTAEVLRGEISYEL